MKNREFLKNLPETDDCILWPFSTRRGYGATWLNGRHVGAHRLSLIVNCGEPPTSSHQAAHSCTNRSCVNPKHLRWATPSENQNDRIAHGTDLRGESVGNSKLNESQIIEIRKSKKSLRALGREYGVTFNNISMIKMGKTWKHVSS